MRRAGLVAVAFAVAAVAAPLACSSSSETGELAHDPADETVPGNLPTAPPGDADDLAGLGVEGNALLAELEAVGEETDLCRVLSGEAFEGLLRDDLDPTGLVTNPSGLTRLVAAIDSTFAHLVDIAPAGLTASMETMREVWTRMAALGQVPDVEARINEMLAEPDVVVATQSIVLWASANCVTAPAGA